MGASAYDGVAPSASDDPRGSGRTGRRLPGGDGGDGRIACAGKPRPGYARGGIVQGAIYPYPRILGYQVSNNPPTVAGMAHWRSKESLRTALGATGFSALLLLRCSTNSNDAPPGAVDCTTVNPDAGGTLSAATCFPDHDGIVGGAYVVDIGVDDNEFTAIAPDDDSGATMKNIIGTQNDANITLTLTNNGTKPHGFQVACVSVCDVYSSLPAGCPASACFPSDSTIAPIQPGASATVMFITPTPDGLIYPFFSNGPGDSAVSGLSNGQWSLM
jgi:hypothetical protein